MLATELRCSFGLIPLRSIEVLEFCYIFEGSEYSVKYFVGRFAGYIFAALAIRIYINELCTDIHQCHYYPLKYHSKPLALQRRAHQCTHENIECICNIKCIHIRNFTLLGKFTIV